MSKATAPFNSASATWEQHREVFFKALQESDRTTLATVLKKYPEAVEWYDAKGTPSLHTAFEKRDLETFKFLLENGADPRQQARITGLRVYFTEYTDPYILEKAIKAGEKDYIIPLLERNAGEGCMNHYRMNGRKAPKAIRFEIIDMLKRADTFHEEFRQQNRAKSKVQTQQASPAPGQTLAGEVEVLKPAKVQRRVPGTPA